MHFDIHFRPDVIDKIKNVVEDIHTWNINDSATADEIAEFSKRVVAFDHCARPDRSFLIAGADGSGDFPCVAYGDSVVYLVTAMSRLYEAASDRLSELPVTSDDVVDFLWLPEDKKKARKQFLDSFSSLIGDSLENICRKSDYFELAKKHGKNVSSPTDLIDNLILPASHEANNISIQLYSTAEVGALVRLMESLVKQGRPDKPIYILEDTTLALPMVTAKSSLFFEIAKRYACEYARENGFTYLTLSKSHNMPHMELIEDEISKVVPSREHWFLRLPSKSTGESKPDFLGTRTIPPVGAVSYLFKLHNTTLPMRLDMSLKAWQQTILCPDKDEQRQREIQMFRDLDFASHDQRSYGYPYPIKACHDMASLTDDERVAMRNQIIEEAVRAGLKRKNFTDPGMLTGHK